MLLYFEFEVNWLAASAAAPCCALRSINISNFNPTVQCSIYPPACCLPANNSFCSTLEKNNSFIAS